MDNETLERIKKEAEVDVSLDPNVDFEDEPYWIKGYIRGATNEHSRITELLNTMDEYIA